VNLFVDLRFGDVAVLQGVTLGNHVVVNLALGVRWGAVGFECSTNLNGRRSSTNGDRDIYVDINVAGDLVGLEVRFSIIDLLVSPQDTTGTTGSTSSERSSERSSGQGEGNEDRGDHDE
jgi:hypothetical protein